MQTNSATRPASSIEIPKVDSAEPVAVTAVASAAPLDGAPDGERINMFTLAPKRSRRTAGIPFVGDVRDCVDGAPLTAVLAAFSLGYLLVRMSR